MENQGNDTCCPSGLFTSYTQRQALVAVISIVAVIGTFGNLLVIAAVVLSKKLRRVTNIFVLNLSVADLLTCTFVVPAQSVAVLGEDSFPLPMGVCSFAAFLLIQCLGCSINNLTCIAINRCLMVTCTKATYLKLFSRRRTFLAITLTWLVPMCMVIVPQVTGYAQLGFEPKYSSCSWVKAETSPGFGPLLFATFLPIQFFLVFFSYIMVFYHIVDHAKRVRKLGGQVRVATVMEVQGRWVWQRPNRHNNLQVQVTVNLFCVMCSFVLCISPYTFSLVFEHSATFTGVAAVILLGNSCVNPMIYAAKHPHFRTVFRCIIRGKFAYIPDRISFRCFM